MTETGQIVDSASVGERIAPDAVDPDLLALPAPPRGQRLMAMTLMAAVMVGSVALIGQIRGDIAYFFAADTVIDLGTARLAKPADMPTNAFVRVLGTPMLSKMVKFTQPLTGSEQVVFPLAGQRHLFVQVPLDDINDPDKGARGEFFGRLVTFGQLRGRMVSVQGYLHDAMDMPVTAESFVLIADEGPESYLWAPLLAALCLGFIVLTSWMLLRWFRPLRIT